MAEAVIVEAQRSPIARGKKIKGDLSGFHPAELLGTVFDGVIEKAGIDPSLVEQVIGGCVTQAGEQAGNASRIAWLNRNKGWAGGGTTIDTQCGSGQQANHLVRALVGVGSIDCGIAGGVEVMSHVGLGANVINGPGFFIPSEEQGWSWDMSPEQFTAAERIAEKRGITRKDVDAWGMRSQQLAIQARDEGRFKNEIVPIEGHDENGFVKLIEEDETIRPETTVESLSQLRPAFDPKNGTVTAGTSSQLTDGASAMVLMSAERAEALGLTPIAKIRSMAVAGCDPAIMGYGPVPATKKALKRAGLKVEDIDFWELNEAFAGQSLPVLKDLKLLGVMEEKVNLNGGAIALGHPLGCSGARISTTLLNIMQAKGGKLGVSTMCIGLGQGIATVWERI